MATAAGALERNGLHLDLANAIRAIRDRPGAVRPVRLCPQVLIAQFASYDRGSDLECNERFAAAVTSPGSVSINLGAGKRTIPQAARCSYCAGGL